MTKRTSWSWRQAILRSEMQATTRHVLLTIACYMNDMGEGAYPSVEQLVSATGLSKRAVIEHIKRAADAGFLSVSQHGYRGQRWKRNEYKALWPAETGDELPEKGGYPDAPPPDEGGNRSAPPSAKVVTDDHHEVVTVVHQDNNTHSKSKNIREPKAGGTKAEVIAALQSHLSPDIAEAYFDHRKAMKKPLTVKAAQLNAKEFGKTTNPDAAAELAIRNGWQGFKAEWARDLPAKEAEPECDWYSRVRYHEVTGEWHPDSWGPVPGQPGCKVPRELLLARIQAKGRAA